MRSFLALLAGLLLGAGALWLVLKPANDLFEPQVETIAAASLDAVRAQNRLSVFAGRFTVAVTSRAERLGFAAEKTMIVPATVKYEIDYSQLSAGDISWDPATARMVVDLPPIELSEPEIDMSDVRDYGEGAVLLTVGGANEALDRANRRKVRAAVMEEAGSELMLQMARDSARSAAARSFRLPLEAAGIPAQVIVRFPDESGSAM
ncbi:MULTISPECIES: DUF4230 domain-containing protein [Pacificimonas]|uniref:DUF4230 domain-containing protein n=1 Tax=Pacificimonas aurantium TaxID=1250540 RepID=A0ABS7WFM4_9SPHN|nr:MULTISPECIES: DUF4230 domain-containing protein [Pacificimonas]MBZ6377198.1 DUF4230 domain-containing protein [Pacificimonas aurantium]